MKFHIFSDPHIDYNKNGFSSPESENQFMLDDCFNLCAGDISGYDSIRYEWLDKQIQVGKIGAFVAGNHDFIYQPHKNKKTYDELVDDCLKTYGQAPITFLNNTYLYIPDEDLVVWGSTLWTNFKCGFCGNPDTNGYFVEHAMNDYRFEIWPREGGGLRRSRWQDFCKMHNRSMESLTKCLEDHPHSRFVVLTHHAPSPKSISPMYVDSDANAGYVSNLEDFILDHPQIKLWVHGHIHSPSDYEIGDCRVVCNPFGYIRHYEDTQYDPNLIIEI